MEFRSTLISREPAAQDTEIFTFEKPEGYQFVAGQYMTLYLPHSEGDELRSYKHTFSICCAPHENVLQIMTRIRDSKFKHGIHIIPEGTEAMVGLAGGTFVLPESNSQPNSSSDIRSNSSPSPRSKPSETRFVFIVGGIGITPVRSILRDVGHTKKKHLIEVYWSNKNQETTPLFDEFNNDYIVNKKPNISLNLIMTRDQSWAGEKGRIDLGKVEKIVGSPTENKIFYVVGTEDFVVDVTSMLTSLGVALEYIKSDAFGGY